MLLLFGLFWRVSLNHYVLALGCFGNRLGIILFGENVGLDCRLGLVVGSTLLGRRKLLERTRHSLCKVSSHVLLSINIFSLDSGTLLSWAIGELSELIFVHSLISLRASLHKNLVHLSKVFLLICRLCVELIMSNGSTASRTFILVLEQVLLWMPNEGLFRISAWVYHNLSSAIVSVLKLLFINHICQVELNNLVLRR